MAEATFLVAPKLDLVATVLLVSLVVSALTIVSCSVFALEMRKF